MKVEKAIDKSVSLLEKCESLLFITGAGISAESGLPTYRGIGGLYNDMQTENGTPIEVALSGATLEKSPEISWKYLAQIEENCRGATFNRAHKVIAEMEGHFPRVWTLTQNVDGFHTKAGSKNIIDIHGDMHRLYCTSCDYQKTVVDYSCFSSIPPQCPECKKKYLRPDVVFFGEMLPFKKVFQLQCELTKGFDIIFTIGTSSLFPYIQLPVVEAKRYGTPTVEINPEKTDVSRSVDIRIATGASSALDAIWTRYREIILKRQVK